MKILTYILYCFFSDNTGQPRKSRPKSNLKTGTESASDLDFNKGSTNRNNYGNGTLMERRSLKARPKVDSMGHFEGQMETTTQSKSDYKVRFLEELGENC